eukprot:158674_1
MMANRTTFSSYMSVDSVVNDNVLRDSFKWLNKMLLYIPMWVSRYPQISNITLENPYQIRNKPIGIFIILLSIMGLLYHATIIIWSLIDNMQSGDHIVYYGIYIIITVLLAITRFLGIIYFMNYFNYPWILCIDRFQKNIYEIYSKQIKRYSKFILFMTVLNLSLDVYYVINVTFVAPEQLLFDSNMLRIARIIAIFAGRLFRYWPLIITISVVSGIFVKYNVYLLRLTDMCNEDHIEFGDMLNKYETLQQSFKTDYNVYLSWSLKLFLGCSVLDLWISAYESYNWKIFYEFVGFFETCFIMLQYLITASLVTEQFEKFEALLWKCSKTIVLKQDIEVLRYQTLLWNHIQKYPLIVKIGNFKISKVNGVKFVVLFLISKGIAYSVRVFVSDSA